MTVASDTPALPAPPVAAPAAAPAVDVAFAAAAAPVAVPAAPDSASDKPGDLARECCVTKIKEPHLPDCPWPREDHPAEPADPVDHSAPVAPPAAPVWPHQTIDFYGDTLEVRTPSLAAYNSAFMFLAAAAPDQIKISLSNRFLINHLSTDSYAQVVARMMDPEREYAEQPVGELIRRLLTMTEQANTPAS